MIEVPAGRPVADLDAGDVVGRRDDRLADQEAGRELDVVARGAHGHGQRRAVDPDAERLLARGQAGAGRPRPRPLLPPPPTVAGGGTSTPAPLAPRWNRSNARAES